MPTVSPGPLSDALVDPTRADQRLTELEIKSSYMEDMVEQLNQIIIRQQQDLDTLVRQVSQLRAQLRDASAGGGGAAGPGSAGGARDELPPHY